VVNLGWTELIFWNLFERTGSITAYLAYRNVFELAAEDKKTGISIKG